MRTVVIGVLGSVLLGCGGIMTQPVEQDCPQAALLSAVRSSNAGATSVSRFACLHGHALATVTMTGKGQVPEVLYFLAEEQGSWSVVGVSKTIDQSLCEHSRNLSFDECGELWAAFETK